jgi:phenylpyruvate tautomerase PptA (4-oxalocrotonate tautomerase family)
MPTTEVTIRRLREAQKRQIARGIARALIDAGIPRESIRIIFRRIRPKMWPSRMGASRTGRRAKAKSRADSVTL